MQFIDNFNGTVYGERQLENSREYSKNSVVFMSIYKMSPDVITPEKNEMLSGTFRTMKSFKFKIFQNLSFRILAPAVMVMLIMGGGLYVFTLRLISGVKDAAVFSSLLQSVQMLYAVTAALLALAGLLLFLIINRNVRLPMESILADIHAGRKPHYAGIREFEFLSVSIGRMMNAVKVQPDTKKFLDEIINCVGDPIFVKNRRHCWILVNDAFCAFMGRSRSELLGKSSRDFFQPEEADLCVAIDERVLSSGEESIMDEVINDAQKGKRNIINKKTLYINPRGERFIVGIIRDVTEQKILEEQLRQAVKMEAIGALAGGVAHDFNNLMTAVIGYCDLVMYRIPKEDPLRHEIVQIKKAGNRAASLTGQLLAFSRKQIMQPRILNLNDVITDIEKMLRRLIGEDICLTVTPDPILSLVNVDPGLMDQVIMNLAINARDAMPCGGNLTIETSNVYLDEAYTRRHFGVASGWFVMLAVSDSGDGMDKETLTHIFEPFFTTKEKGKGTGLGLATVYGIVKQSGGHLWVYSELGHGTTFKIYLPRAEAQDADTLPETGTCSSDGNGSETILLVEDDAIVRQLVEVSLKMKGYSVLVAEDGVQASVIIENHRGPLHLLITDVVMPGMSGVDVAKKLQSFWPEIRVLYMSGYTSNAIVHHGVLDKGTAFLQKPFTPEALACKVREVLTAS